MKRVIAVILTVMMFVGLVSGCSGSNEKHFEYEDVSGGIKITKYTGNSSKVVVPETIDGKLVVSVGETFSGNVNITSLELPENCRYADLRNCKNIKYLAFPGATEIDDIAAVLESVETLIIPGVSRVILSDITIPNLQILDISGAYEVEVIRYHTQQEYGEEHERKLTVTFTDPMAVRAPLLKEINLSTKLCAYRKPHKHYTSWGNYPTEFIGGNENTIICLNDHAEYDEDTDFTSREYSDIVLTALGYDELTINGVKCKK